MHAEILCETIMATNLNDDLMSELWTAFFPTNEAFEALPEEAVENLMDDTIALTDLLLFHVTGGVFNSSSLGCGEELTMANGDVTTTFCEESDSLEFGNSNLTLFQAGPGNLDETSYPEIIMADMQACNGIVHVIDQVLLFDNVTFITQPDFNITDVNTTTTTAPTSAPTTTTSNVTATLPPSSDCDTTLASYICGNDDFSTLCAALLAADLAEPLSLNSSSNYTVFAPNNDAFAKLGDAALQYLLQPTQQDLLVSLLLFHTVPNATLRSTDLNCVAGPDSLVTMGNGEDSRTVCMTPFIYQKGAGNEPDSRRPEIIEADITEACNGTYGVYMAHMAW
jgi:transforming growth factor-beta-induced protein